LDEVGAGSIAFSPLAQGLLTNKYLNGVPEDSRAAAGKSLDQGQLSEDNLGRVRGLNDLAESRGQTLAQMAIAWVLRPQAGGGAITSALVGASSVKQLKASLATVTNLDFTSEELSAIDT
ncbi:aldo/keto reductase, partial [Leifsonia sp. SIMBA_070]|uniref:aldo/keto reductase n=1 Tax=Leifsonia sp. SIMBA_070 TaxID=3085810 RepID=UPI00397958EA